MKIGPLPLKMAIYDPLCDSQQQSEVYRGWAYESWACSNHWRIESSLQFPYPNPSQWYIGSTATDQHAIHKSLAITTFKSPFVPSTTYTFPDCINDRIRRNNPKAPTAKPFCFSPLGCQLMRWLKATGPNPFVVPQPTGLRCLQGLSSSWTRKTQRFTNKLTVATQQPTHRATRAVGCHDIEPRGL